MNLTDIGQLYCWAADLKLRGLDVDRLDLTDPKVQDALMDMLRAEESTLPPQAKRDAIYAAWMRAIGCRSLCRKGGRPRKELP